MPASVPRDSTLAVVGDGFGSLIVYATAIYLGYRPEEIAIFGTNDNPVGTYQQFAHNLGQTVLRSESESHFLPADWPTFAQLDAWSRRSPAPLYRSIKRKYNPGVPDILAEASVVQRRLGWEHARVPRRVGWLQREDGPPRHFVLYDEDANFIGRAKHVMMALGHGPLQFPPVLAKAKSADPEVDQRIVQAYAPKQYHPSGRYIVIGAGIASINEWANALDAGAKVIALRRNPAPDEQDLNVPRCLFEALGIDIFQGLAFEDRIAFLGQVLKGTAPKRRSWRERIENGRAEGRFDELIGEIDQAERGPAGLRVHISSRHGEDPGWLDVTGVCAGTGFVKSALALPLLRRLVEFYEIPVVDGRIRLKSNCGVPGLDQPDSRLCMMGLTANSVIPHGDTIAGLKYIGRRFVGDVYDADPPKKRPFPSRLGMQLSLAQGDRPGDPHRPTRGPAGLVMCPSVLGRVETRTAILIGPALLGLILYFVTDNLGYLVLLGIYYLIGVALDIVVYPQIIKWQPPWLTFVLGAGEFVIVYFLGKILEVPLESFDAIWFYWVSWTMAVWTRIVILPIVSLTWIESGGEFRRTGWSHPAEQEPLPVVAALQDRPVGEGGLLREFSSVHQIPQELKNLPAPSGVHQVPR